MTVSDPDSALIKRLTKCKKTGEVYTRRENTELQLGLILQLDQNQISEFLKIKDKNNENYLLDETLVYLLRQAETDGFFREELYIELNRRLWKLLKKFYKNFPNQADFEDFGQKIEMAILRKIFDFATNSADYMEVNFGDYVVKTAKVEWRGELVKIKRTQELFYTEHENEDLINSIENKLKSNEALADYTMMLKEGLAKLPTDTMTVVELLIDGWQIESKSEFEPTISKKLGVSSRTIRHWLKEAKNILKDYRAEVRK